MIVQDITVVNFLSDLKAKRGAENTIVLLVGRLTMGDGFGALYWWDGASIDKEDMTNLNVVQATGVQEGRWKRLNVKTQSLPHGLLVVANGKKEFYYSGKIDSVSTCTVNLTMDNTPTGEAIFKEIWYDDSIANVNAATPNDAISSYRKSLSADKKILTHGYYRGASTQLGNTLILIAGLIITSFRPAPAGTVVNFKVEGA